MRCGPGSSPRAVAQVAGGGSTYAVTVCKAVHNSCPLRAIGQVLAAVTFVIVLLALALTGWISAQISDVHPVRPIVRTAAIGILSMTITYAAGHLFYP